MDELFEGVLSLTSVEECYNFFEGSVHDHRTA